jgi:hypothetical protein
MLIQGLYITAPKSTEMKPLIEVVHEFCEENEPKPLYCELPDELKLKTVDASGTAQTYTYTNSLATTPAFGTSTTTTFDT